MELVGDHRATEGTQHLLLDDFMQGFIFTLIRQKWERFTSYAFYALRLYELVYLICVVAMSFQVTALRDTCHCTRPHPSLRLSHPPAPHPSRP